MQVEFKQIIFLGWEQWSGVQGGKLNGIIPQMVLKITKIY